MLCIFYPQEFKLEHIKPELKALSLPADLTIMQAIDRVLRLPSVASKRYLTNKVCDACFIVTLEKMA